MWPFCPHTRIETVYGVVGDDIPGGQVIDNLGHEPMTFYSKKAILAEADRRGLRLRDQWAGPGDRYLTNWSAASAKTLADGKALVERVGKANSTAEECALIDATFTVGPWHES